MSIGRRLDIDLPRVAGIALSGVSAYFIAYAGIKAALADYNGPLLQHDQEIADLKADIRRLEPPYFKGRSSDQSEWPGRARTNERGE